MLNTNDIPEIAIMRYWFSDYVVMLCFNNKFYTRDDANDQCKMVNFVKTHEPTPENLYIVARDILEHSDAEINNRYAITDIMVLLDKETVILDFIDD